MAELRSLCRMARTWVFVGSAIAVALTAYGYYSYIHDRAGFGWNAGYFSPRYTSAYFNIYLLWFFMAAVVFLGFDGRARDERAGIAEVLDSRPVSNVAVLAGRWCAVVLAVVVPLFAGLILIQVAGVVAEATGFEMLAPVESVSVLTFLVVDAIPALVLWCAWVLLLAAAFRNRLAVAAVALALLGLHMWALALVPTYLLPALSPTTIHDVWASDLAPRFPELETYVQRLAELLLTVGFLLSAAVLFKRRDGIAPKRRLIVGMVTVVAGAACIVTIAIRAQGRLDLRDAWLEAHQTAAMEYAGRLPDVQQVTGELRLDPGKSLDLDVILYMRHSAQPASKLLFSLNPGLRIVSVRLDDAAVPYEFQHGLLTLVPAEPVVAGAEHTLALQVSGLPDAEFAYLDSTIDWRRRSSRNGILWLGTQAGIYEPRYVALMPGLRWLPTPGANVEDQAAEDPFALDLVISAPTGWLVAAPGLRETLGSGRFRFRPAAPVAAAPVFAAPFVRYADTVAGVDVELLVHPTHRENLDDLAMLGAPLSARLAEAFERADDLGIPYPYRAFTGVEVPGHLRGYGGGWALDTVMALPAMVLVREHGIPHSRLPVPYRLPTGDPADLIPGTARYLEMMLSLPRAEGSVLRAVARNLTTFQTAARGTGAEALDLVAEMLAARLVGAALPGGISSAHSSDTDAGFGATVVGMVRGLNQSGPGATAFRPFLFDNQSAWDTALAVPLARLAEHDEPLQGLRALGARGSAVATTIRDGIGAERAGALLAMLRDRHANAGYDARDFAAVAEDVDADLQSLLGNWLHDTALPGFLASTATVYRLTDSETGEQRYQVSVHVRNDEPIPGLVALGPHLTDSSTRGPPTRVAGLTSVEMGIVLTEPPTGLWLMPYLALNRSPLHVAMPNHIDPAETRDVAPFVGARPGEWLPAPIEGIVVDDLDHGFAVRRATDDARVGQDAPTAASTPLDRGLPTYSGRSGEWVRAAIPGGWGKYRRTVAGALAGDGGAVAVFETVLPRTGGWRIDYFIPKAEIAMMGLGGSPSWRLFGPLGSMAMRLVAGTVETKIDFDAGAAEPGWNKLGEYDIGAGPVRLEISSRTSGQVVVADAVRWVPVP